MAFSRGGHSSACSASCGKALVAILSGCLHAASGVTLRSHGANALSVLQQNASSLQNASSQQPGDCAAAGDCGSCSKTPGCGWCGVERRCVAGTKLGPQDGPCGAYGYSSCIAVPCSGRASCGACTADPSCGWCASSSKCMDGVSAGPLNAGGGLAACSAWMHASLSKASCDGTASYSGLWDAIEPLEKASLDRVQELSDKVVEDAARTQKESAEKQRLKEWAERQIAEEAQSSSTARPMEDVVREVVLTDTTTTTTTPSTPTTPTEPMERVVMRVLRTSTTIPIGAPPCAYWSDKKENFYGTQLPPCSSLPSSQQFDIRNAGAGFQEYNGQPAPPPSQSLWNLAVSAVRKAVR